LNFKIIHIDNLGSTNDYLLEKIENRENPEEGLLVIASEQKSGKGIDGTVWESEPGKNLTFSLVVKPSFLRADQQFLINKMAALAVFDLIKFYLPGESVTIKWPNDIYVRNKKIAGILIHHTVMGNRINFSVLGYGININQEVFKGDAPNPVSIKNILGRDLELAACIDKICENIQLRYLQLSGYRFDVLDKNYQQVLYRKDEYYDYRYEDEVIKAKITGVNNFGRLQLDLLNGRQIECDFKEIIYIL
jgi:BirA family biotin operon repressor/biotin-[acetyl-CoA-carboxylase] ligase